MNLGIQTDPLDTETVFGYWIDGMLVDAENIQHRKANVDSNVKRGLPLLTPVRKNLRRAEKLLRNMSVVAEIQSAIALIRKHQTTEREAIRQFVQNQQNTKTVVDAETGQIQAFRHFSPGTIIDSGSNTEYEFPVSAIDASRYILVLQAELRAIASRLVMPEFMLTSDASNANYASTMIAEGPAVRMFERLQHEIIGEDRQLFKAVIHEAMLQGLLPEGTCHKVSIHAIPPMLAARDRLNEAKADAILYNLGVLSKETLAMRYGLDPSQEERLCLCGG
jgi:capsid protein